MIADSAGSIDHEKSLHFAIIRVFCVSSGAAPAGPWRRHNCAIAGRSCEILRVLSELGSPGVATAMRTRHRRATVWGSSGFGAGKKRSSEMTGEPLNHTEKVGRPYGVLRKVGRCHSQGYRVNGAALGPPSFLHCQTAQRSSSARYLVHAAFAGLPRIRYVSRAPGVQSVAAAKYPDWTESTKILPARVVLNDNPTQNLEVGHKVTTVAHLVNIGLRTGRTNLGRSRRTIAADRDANRGLHRVTEKPGAFSAGGLNQSRLTIVNIVTTAGVRPVTSDHQSVRGRRVTTS